MLSFTVMKRLFLWIISIVSGLYLLIVGPLIDPIPFIDEAIALAIFLKATSALGYDVRRWLPFFGKGGSAKPGKQTVKAKDMTVDV